MVPRLITLTLQRRRHTLNMSNSTGFDQRKKHERGEIGVDFSALMRTRDRPVIPEMTFHL